MILEHRNMSESCSALSAREVAPNDLAFLNDVFDRTDEDHAADFLDHQLWALRTSLDQDAIIVPLFVDDGTIDSCTL